MNKVSFRTNPLITTLIQRPNSSLCSLNELSLERVISTLASQKTLSHQHSFSCKFIIYMDNNNSITI